MSKVIKKKFKVIVDIDSRLSDLDVNQHVNFIHFYSYFDSALNNFLTKKNIIDFSKGDILDLVVENKCNFYEPVCFPCTLKVGFSVSKIGNTSVTYILGLFKKNKIIASGHIVHVYVDKKNYTPKKIGKKFRSILENIFVVLS